MPATLEAPPPAVVAPAPRRTVVTTAELEAARKWFAENVKTCPVIPPGLKGAERFWPLTPEKVLGLSKQNKEQTTALINAINQQISLMEMDPLYYGYEPSCWADADALVKDSLLTCIFGGNGSSKTFYAARCGIKKMLEKPNAKVLWLHEAQDPSVDIQQAAVYNYLPSRFKRMKFRKSDRVTKINYSKSTGFLAAQGHKFVLPNGSLGMFGYYNQDIKVCEGYGWDLVLADEDLPLGWLKTLLFRLPRQGGKMIWTFTPIRGITPAIKDVVDGAKTLKSLPAELLDPKKVHVPGSPKGQMPYIQQGEGLGAKIIYFFTEMNPWSGYQDHKKVLAKATVEEIERRTYGWARQTIGKRFPKFGAHNIVSEVPPNLTRYVFKDPASARNAFIMWVGVDKHRRHYIYREWPDVETYGEWAVTSESSKRFDGDMGPGQKCLGLGIVGYKRTMLAAEGNTWTGTNWTENEKTETIFLRYGDSRAMASPSGVEEGEGTAMFDRYREAQTDKDGNIEGPSMDFLPAPGYHIDRGVEMVNDLLNYDANEPITAMINEPRLYVHKRCKNIIWAMQNWTGLDGEKGASKDPVDNVRMMATADLQYHDPKAQVSYGGGSY